MKKNRALLLLLPTLLILVALILAGCKDFSFFGVLGDRIDDTPLQIAPAAASVAESGGLLTFTATGGIPPYTYSVTSGASSGSVTATGSFTASAAGTVIVRVTDSKGRTSDAAITVNPTGTILTISPVSVSMSPGGSLAFVASGGTGPYTFSLTASGSGSPTIGSGTGAYVAGASIGTDTIQVQDSAVPPDTATAAVDVAAAMVTVDYSLDEVNFNIPTPVTGGSAFAGTTFRIQNAAVADGGQTIFWWVYLSDDGALGSGDTLLDAGNRGPLAAGTFSDVAFSGTWPLSSGAKSLFVMISSADDLEPANNQSAGAGAPVTLNLPDYAGTLVHTSGTAAGAAFTGTLTIDNAGSADGSQDVSWSVYASLGDTDMDMDDKIVATGTIPGGLGVTASPEVIAIANTWPTVAGTYYLIADLFAGDDANTTNNKPFSLGIAVAAPPVADVDYLGAVVHSTGFTAGVGFTGTLTISNGGATAGVQDVSWSVYASLGNATLGAGDTLVASGVISGGLGAGDSTVPALSIANSWPATAGTYFLVADIQASDDVNAGNDQPSSGAVTVSLPADYSGVLSAGTPTRAGGSFTSSLTISNGAAAGSRTVYWSVYASLGNTTIEAGDKLVGSGSLAGLGAGASTVPALSISNSWPTATGDYYLVARIQADDDVNTANNTPFSAVVAVGATDYSGVVEHLLGTMAGAAFTGRLTISNIGGAYALAGSQDLYWNVYASLGNTTISADDKVVGSGSLAGLGAGASTVPALSIANTWPEAPGPYFLVADIFAGDDANSINNRPSTSVAVTAPPPPDYSVAFSTPPAWSAVLSAAITGEIRIQNISGNDGLKPINYSIYRSADKVIDGGDAQLLTGSRAPLGAGGSADLPAVDGDLWPATSQFWFLIAVISAADDSNLGNNTRVSNPTAVANIILPEEAEPYNNGDNGPPFNDVSIIPLDVPLNGSIAVEGLMDAFNLWDTYQLQMAAGATRLRVKARWATSFDDMDMYFGSGSALSTTTSLYTIETDPDTEPAGETLFAFMSLVSTADYQLGVNFWLANNASGSTGQKYVLLLIGLP